MKDIADAHSIQVAHARLVTKFGVGQNFLEERGKKYA